MISYDFIILLLIHLCTHCIYINIFMHCLLHDPFPLSRVCLCSGLLAVQYALPLRYAAQLGFHRVFFVIFSVLDWDTFVGLFAAINCSICFGYISKLVYMIMSYLDSLQPIVHSCTLHLPFSLYTVHLWFLAVVLALLAF